MFLNRLKNDPAFAERIHANQRAKANGNVCLEGDITTEEEWQEVLDGPNSGPSEAKGDFDAEHHRISEIRTVAQALCFRDATPADVPELVALVNLAYEGERVGQPEGFNPNPCTDAETVAAMVADPDCSWLLAECPSAASSFDDGAILGCCCYSMGGAASQNSKEKVGAIRLLAVLPRFHGLCVGRRVLHRVQGAMAANGCEKSLACVPELRKGIIAWAGRRGYEQVSTAKYPPAMSATFSRPNQLLVLAKLLPKEAEVASSTADAKANQTSRPQVASAAANDSAQTTPADPADPAAGQGQGAREDPANETPEPPRPATHPKGRTTPAPAQAAPAPAPTPPKPPVAETPADQVD